LVIAEFNSNMSVTAGDSRIKLADIDLAYESDDPLLEYATPAAQEIDVHIVENVMSLVPEGSWVQHGIGSVPDRILARLGEIAGVKLCSGLLTGALKDFLRQVRHTPEVIAGELAGDRDFYEF
jgi:acyl-CoA hydrolase